MTDRATKKQIRYILALNHQLGGRPTRYANQLAVDLPLRLRAVDLHTATRRQASEIIQRLLEQISWSWDRLSAGGRPR